MLWILKPKKGNVYETKSYVNRDIFFEEKELMQSSYYANKLPQYYDDIRSGKRKVATWYNIRKDLVETMKRYNTKTVCAHNARFDYNSCTKTQRYLTKSAYRYLFPKGIEIWDTLAMARSIYGKSPTYRKWCEQNGYLTKTGQVRLTAEILYRYITGDSKFIESHTGLEDVLIEKEIFRKCMAWHRPMQKRLFRD